MSGMIHIERKLWRRLEWLATRFGVCGWLLFLVGLALVIATGLDVGVWLATVGLALGLGIPLLLVAGLLIYVVARLASEIAEGIVGIVKRGARRLR